MNNLKGIELLRGTMLHAANYTTQIATRFCIPLLPPPPSSSCTRVTRVNSSRARASSNFNPSRVSFVFSRLRFHIDKAGQLTTRPSTISFVSPGNRRREYYVSIRAALNRNENDRFSRRKRVKWREIKEGSKIL